jgi:hypothetical protein
MKKTLNLLAVMLLTIAAGSFLMMGCSNPTDGSAGANGAPGSAQFSGSESPEFLASLYKRTNVVYLVGDLTGTGVYTVPAGKTMAIVGNATIGNTAAINAYNGYLDVSDADSITVTSGGALGALIVNPSYRDAVVAKTIGSVPSYLNVSAGLPDDPITEDVVVVGGFPSAIVTATSSDGIKAGDLAAFSGSNTVYVIGDVEVNTGTSGGVNITSSLVVLGELQASGAGGLTLGTGVKADTLKASDALTITAVGAGTIKTLDLNGKTVAITAVTNIPEIINGATAATVALDTGTGLPSVVVGDADITVTTTGGSLTVADLSTPKAGKLVLPATAVAFTATDGGGKIAYASAPASAVTLVADAGETLTYVGNFAPSTGGLTITTAHAVFNGNLTAAGVVAPANLTVNGNLEGTGSAAIAVTGALRVTGNVTLTTSGNLTAGPSSAITGTLTSKAAQTITFPGTINTLTLDGAGARSLSGSTISNLTALPGSATLAVTGVKLAGENAYTLATDVTAKNVTLSGIILGTFTDTLPANGTVLIDGEGSELAIAASVALKLTDATSTITISSGGKLSVTTATAGITEVSASIGDLKLSVTDSEDNPSKATVVVATGLITADTTGSTGTVVLGTTQFAVTGTANVTNQAAASAGQAAAGSLTAGAGTVLILAGTT